MRKIEKSRGLGGGGEVIGVEGEEQRGGRGEKEREGEVASRHAHTHAHTAPAAYRERVSGTQDRMKTLLSCVCLLVCAVR